MWSSDQSLVTLGFLREVITTPILKEFDQKNQFL